MEIKLTRLDKPAFIPVSGMSFHGSAELIGWYVAEATDRGNILAEIDPADLAKVGMGDHVDRDVPLVAVIYTDEDYVKHLVIKYLLVNYSSKYHYTLEMAMGQGSAHLNSMVQAQLTRMGDLWSDALK
jgi:hypothetical protein